MKLTIKVCCQTTTSKLETLNSGMDKEFLCFINVVVSMVRRVRTQIELSLLIVRKWLHASMCVASKCQCFGESSETMF